MVRTSVANYPDTTLQHSWGFYKLVSIVRFLIVQFCDLRSKEDLSKHFMYVKNCLNTLETNSI
jgi:hypothetical protein